jgi:transcriptional regulator with XRE-family HTH domain
MKASPASTLLATRNTKSGVSLRSIVLLENVRQEPYPSTLRKLSDALDVDPSRLIEGRPL